MQKLTLQGEKKKMEKEKACGSKPEEENMSEWAYFYTYCPDEPLPLVCMH